MNIFGWAADDAGPGFYRLRVPLNEIRHHTMHRVAIDTQMPDWVVEEADVVIGQRVAQPGSTERWRRMASGVYGHRPLLVLELDDDLWEVDASNGPAWSFYKRNPQLLDNLTECVRVADVCTVSTEPLADVVRRINPNVVVLPNQLPASAFAFRSYPEPTGSVRIGWGGGASHFADVNEMVAGLRQHFRRRPRDTFVNMGTLFGAVARAAGDRLNAVPWTTDMAEHYSRVSQLDIGLAPLRPSVFNQSKSELKFLEYAAAGVACIATKHGPYERTMEHGVTGLLVSRPHEWVSALRTLTEHPDERLFVASNALAYARWRSIEDHWTSWLDVYEKG